MTVDLVVGRTPSGARIDAMRRKKRCVCAKLKHCSCQVADIRRCSSDAKMWFSGIRRKNMDLALNPRAIWG
jgi:hypothetical protein